MHYKYPKTMHMLFSQGLQNDDRMIEDANMFDGKHVAVTIKMDGENTSMYRNGIHARSLYSAHHPSQSIVKALHSTIRNDIPEGWRICGENMYAKHSIYYDDLESFFYVFSVWDENNMCLSLKETRKFCRDLNLSHVKVYCEIQDFPHDGMFMLERSYKNVIADGEEGIVVRNADGYHYKNFGQNLAKAVRPNHVQTDVHWSKEWIPNRLKELT